MLVADLDPGTPWSDVRSAVPQVRAPARRNAARQHSLRRRSWLRRRNRDGPLSFAAVLWRADRIPLLFAVAQRDFSQKPRFCGMACSAVRRRSPGDNEVELLSAAAVEGSVMPSGAVVVGRGFC